MNSALQDGIVECHRREGPDDFGKEGLKVDSSEDEESTYSVSSDTTFFSFICFREGSAVDWGGTGV